MKKNILVLAMLMMTGCGATNTYIPYTVAGASPTPVNSCVTDITDDALAIIAAAVNDQIAPAVLDSVQLAANIKDAIAKTPCTPPSK